MWCVCVFVLARTPSCLTDGLVYLNLCRNGCEFAFRHFYIFSLSRVFLKMVCYMMYSSPQLIWNCFFFTTSQRPLPPPPTSGMHFSHALVSSLSLYSLDQRFVCGPAQHVRMSDSHVRVHVCMFECVYVCVLVYICICIYICMHVHVRMRVFMCTCILSAWMYVCV
jgi:hypothetical protein